MFGYEHNPDGGLWKEELFERARDTGAVLLRRLYERVRAAFAEKTVSGELAC
jgi:hypothetical protein